MGYDHADGFGRYPREGLADEVDLLMADPPATYAEISDRLGFPVGSIGPTRGRCLEMLRGLLEAP